ncbi:MAG: shikimate dehydrogenase [Syntrophomonas sp.]|uniref:shikimate dehydrogenase n=1 Tax=Syntrophomonas sp. TaxID=2053627 RepID=UPI002628ABFF|nr:shikimate dehydrogenase [Syntrophomonas sp.]MDD2511372.1 shikimate dehydrogenase [Syntrophomonas sp.]MDD3880030.1 shikimate dehydrogenase [Syntrophomonas sp.]MDD4627502.1 shikimate dehydrogenase [Syntrophomonas sp.]
MQIDINTILLGLVGCPLQHSLSPLMHNLTLEKMGINSIYLPLEIPEEKLPDLPSAIRTLNFRGLNVTIPYKEKIIPFLDGLSTEASACGAVNVIKNDNGRLQGYNTDGRGFVEALREERIDPGGRALFIGAGGAARSVAFALTRAGVSRLDFLDLDLARARLLADLITSRSSSSASASLMNTLEFQRLSQTASIIINCSPVGMFPNSDKSPVNKENLLGSRAVLCDLIYNPLQSRFLSWGQALGLKTMNGLGMFVQQGALTLEILLGQKPPLDYMKEVVQNQLEKRIHPA